MEFIQGPQVHSLHKGGACHLDHVEENRKERERAVEEVPNHSEYGGHKPLF
jgi:hypothetical protein